MEFGVFLICSLLFAGSYVDSRSLPHANGEFVSVVRINNSVHSNEHFNFNFVFDINFILF